MPEGSHAEEEGRGVRLPGLAAWLVGTIVAVPLGLMGLVLWVILDPGRWLQVADTWLPEPLSVHADRLELDASAGWRHPERWRWDVEGFSFLGASPNGPHVMLDEGRLSMPRVWPSPTLGVRVVVPEARLGYLTLYWPDRTVPTEPNWRYHPLTGIEVGEATAAHLDLLMAKDGPRPELLILGDEVSLTAWKVDPRTQSMTGDGVVPDASVSVAGVTFEHAHTDDLRFTGPGLSAHVTAELAGDDLEVDLTIEPLMGPPLVTVDARMQRGDLASVANGIVGLKPEFVNAVVWVDAHLTTGRPLPGEETLRGHADVRAEEVKLALPEESGFKARAAVGLAPFLTIDDGVVDVPTMHGRIRFTSSSLTLHDLQLEAPHSTGHLDGSIRGSALRARLDMRPRPGQGAIRWGLLLDGTFDEPKVRLAFPPKLDAWED